MRALINRAGALTGLEQFEAALADWEAALQLNDGQLDYEIGVGKATTWFRSGRYDEALDLAIQTAEEQDHPSLVYALARELSLGVYALAEADLTAAGRSRWIDKYATTSVQLLQRAANMGYFADDKTIGFLDEDDYLEPLRGRQDYQVFLDGLKK